MGVIQNTHYAPSLAPLEGLRVLDLSDGRGQYCAKMFADLGAEVILIEPKGGSPVRSWPPFFDNRPGSESSIPFFFLNQGKEGHVLALDEQDDRAAFLALVREADVVIETEAPGVMEARGLGFDTLSAIRPRLVHVSITPFGQSGPYVEFEADDLVLLALGGLLSLGGYVDGPPMAPYGNQGYLAASQFAAVAAMAALIRADETGQGEYIDVSIQECVAMALENAVQFYDLEGLIRPRAEPVTGFSGQYRASDGFFLVMAGGVASSAAWHTLVRWMGALEPSVLEDLEQPRWIDPEYTSSSEARGRFGELMASVASSRTRAELYQSAKEFRVAMAPVLSPRDMLASPQLAAREFFREVTARDSGRKITVPRPPYQFSTAVLPNLKGAPLLGQRATWARASAGAAA